MKAIIPCAKKEESLYPFTESKPTALMPVAGKPLVKHLIKDLQDLGIDDVYLVTNYLEEQFREMFDGYTNVNIVTQEELTGTGTAVETCDFIEEDFVVVNGDVVTSKEDLSRLIDKHEETEGSSTILATEDRTPEKFGVLSIENDKVVKLEEKPEDPKNTLVNTGIYVFDPEIFSILENIEKEEGEHKSVTEGVEVLIEDRDVRFELVQDYWIDIGSCKKLWEADRVVRNARINDTEIHDDAEVADNVEILGNAKIEKDAVIKSGTVIEGDVFIGEDCVIGPNTMLKDVTVNRETQLRGCEIVESVLFEKNIVDSFTSIEDAIIAEESDIKSNTVIRESFIGPRSFVEVNNSIYGVKFVPDARTDLSEISK